MFQMRVADVGVTALTAVYGTEYEYGSIANIICEFVEILNFVVSVA